MYIFILIWFTLKLVTFIVSLGLKLMGEEIPKINYDNPIYWIVSSVWLIWAGHLLFN